MLVKIIKLPQSRAVSFHIKDSETPERDGWSLMKKWAVTNNIFDSPTDHQIYGRNNPVPIDNPPLRGYEFLVTIPDDHKVSGDITEVNFPGGLYAVVTSKGLKQMVANWNKLMEWIENNPGYSFGYPEDYDYKNQPSLELEQHLHFHLTSDDENEENFLIDYYFPIKENK